MKRFKSLVILLLTVLMCVTTVMPVQAETFVTESGDTYEANVYFYEDFEDEWALVGSGVAKGINSGITNGITVQSVDAGTDNKAMNLISDTTKGSTDYQINVRYSNQSAWNEDACVSDLSEKTVVYEFKFKLQREESNGLTARLRSKNSGNKETVLFAINHNKLDIF